MTREQLAIANKMSSDIIILSDHIETVRNIRDNYKERNSIEFGPVLLRQEFLDKEGIIDIYILRAERKLTAMRKEFGNFTVTGLKDVMNEECM